MEASKYKVEISGPLLSLIYESLWESASIREGLLLGDLLRSATSTISDDQSTLQQDFTIRITSYFPLELTSVLLERNSSLSDLLDSLRENVSLDAIVGWYRARSSPTCNSAGAENVAAAAGPLGTAAGLSYKEKRVHREFVDLSAARNRNSATNRRTDSKEATLPFLFGLFLQYNNPLTSDLLSLEHTFFHLTSRGWLEPLAESAVVNLRASSHTHYSDVAATASRLGSGTSGALNSMRSALSELTHLLRHALFNARAANRDYTSSRSEEERRGEERCSRAPAFACRANSRIGASLESSGSRGGGAQAEARSNSNPVAALDLARELDRKFEEVSEELLAGSQTNGTLLAEIEALERQVRIVRVKRLALECPVSKGQHTAQAGAKPDELPTTGPSEASRASHLKARITRNPNRRIAGSDEPRSASPANDLQAELAPDTLRVEDSSSPTNLISFEASGENAQVAKRLLYDAKGAAPGPTTQRNLLDTDIFDDFMEQLPSIPSKLFLDNELARFASIAAPTTSSTDQNPNQNQCQNPLDAPLPASSAGGAQASAGPITSANEKLEAIDLLYGSIFPEESPHTGRTKSPNQAPSTVAITSSAVHAQSSPIPSARFSAAADSGGSVAINSSSSSNSSSGAVAVASVKPKPVARFNSSATDSSRPVASTYASASASGGGGSSSTPVRTASNASVDRQRGAQSNISSPSSVDTSRASSSDSSTTAQLSSVRSPPAATSSSPNLVPSPPNAARAQPQAQRPTNTNDANKTPGSVHRVPSTGSNSPQTSQRAIDALSTSKTLSSTRPQGSDTRAPKPALSVGTPTSATNRTAASVATNLLAQAQSSSQSRPDGTPNSTGTQSRYINS